MSNSIDEHIRAIAREEARAEMQRLLAEARGDAYLSAQDAARFAGVTDGTIRRWIRAGRLTEHRAGRVVRVLRTDLERLLRDGARSANDDSPEARAARDFG